MDDLAQWRAMCSLVGKREAYRLVHNCEALASPLWIHRSDGPHRLWAYAMFVHIEEMCAEVSKGGKPC